LDDGFFSSTYGRIAHGLFERISGKFRQILAQDDEALQALAHPLVVEHAVAQKRMIERLLEGGAFRWVGVHAFVDEFHILRAGAVHALFLLALIQDVLGVRGNVEGFLVLGLLVLTFFVLGFFVLGFFVLGFFVLGFFVLGFLVLGFLPACE